MAKSTHYHPESELLARNTAGRLPTGLALAVTTHLEMCPDCQQLVAFGEDRRARQLLKSDSSQPETEHDSSGMQTKTVEMFGKQVALPRTLAKLAESGLRWREVTKGVFSAIVMTENETRCAIVHVSPGAVVPRHMHTRTETTQLLDGTLCDDWDCYNPADFVIRGPNQEHALMAHEGCFCLIVTDGPLYFTLGLHRLKNPLIALRYLRIRMRKLIGR